MRSSANISKAEFCQLYSTALRVNVITQRYSFQAPNGQPKKYLSTILKSLIRRPGTKKKNHLKGGGREERESSCKQERNTVQERWKHFFRDQLQPTSLLRHAHRPCKHIPCAMLIKEGCSSFFSLSSIRIHNIQKIICRGRAVAQITFIRQSFLMEGISESSSSHSPIKGDMHSKSEY